MVLYKDEEKDWNFVQAQNLTPGRLSHTYAGANIWFVLDSWMTTDGQYVKMMNLGNMHCVVNPTDILLVATTPPPDSSSEEHVIP